MSPRPSARRLTAPAFGLVDVGIADMAFAVLLSVAAIDSTSGLAHPHEAHVGVAASVVVLLMTVPVAFARRSPLATATALAVGAGLNWVLIGHMTRCGACLPAVFYVGFVVGSRGRSWRLNALALLFLSANITCQAITDPKLGVGVIPFFVPITLAFLAAGRLLRSRNAAVVQLRAQTAELRDQREATARLAVEADHARIAGDLDGYLHDRVEEIAAAAAAGRGVVEAEPNRAHDAFVAIQSTGRETLTHMRGVVSSLHDAQPIEPQPVLAQLDRLLEQSTTADTRLHVTGDARLLLPGLELSGYRIVEHLLIALEDNPAARIDVEITFRADELELTVAGPKARRGNVGPAIAAATERAAVHGGTLHTQASSGRRTTVVRLPIATAQV